MVAITRDSQPSSAGWAPTAPLNTLITVPDNSLPWFLAPSQHQWGTPCSGWALRPPHAPGTPERCLASGVERPLREEQTTTLLHIWIQSDLQKRLCCRCHSVSVLKGISLVRRRRPEGQLKDVVDYLSCFHWGPETCLCLRVLCCHLVLFLYSGHGRCRPLSCLPLFF